MEGPWESPANTAGALPDPLRSWPPALHPSRSFCVFNSEGSCQQLPSEEKTPATRAASPRCTKDWKCLRVCIPLGRWEPEPRAQEHEGQPVPLAPGGTDSELHIVLQSPCRVQLRLGLHVKSNADFLVLLSPYTHRDGNASSGNHLQMDLCVTCPKTHSSSTKATGVLGHSSLDRRDKVRGGQKS